MDGALGLTAGETAHSKKERKMKVLVAKTIYRAESYQTRKGIGVCLLLTPKTVESARGRLIEPADIIFVDSPHFFEEDFWRALFPCVPEWY